MRFAIAAVVVVLSLGFEVVSAAEPEHLVIQSPTAPYTLTFDSSRVAKVSVTILNGSGTPVRITTRFVDAGSGAQSDALAPASATPAGQVVIIAPTAPIDIAPGGTRIFDVQLSAGAGTDPSTVSGLIAFASDAPAILGATLAVSGKPTDPFAGARVVPSTVTINANRAWPGFVPNDCDCWADWIEGPSGAARYQVFIDGPKTATGLTDVATYLSSDTGGRLHVILRDFAMDGNGRLVAMVRLAESDRAGAYAGKLSLNPDDSKPTELELTVNVQDFFIWPLIAVLIGELIAFAFAYWRDRRRAKVIPEAAINMAQKEFDAAVAAGTLSEQERSWFDGVFVRPKGHPAMPSLAEKTLDHVEHAKDKNDLADAAKEASDVVAIWASLKDLQEAVARLRKAVDENRPIDPSAAVFTKADDLLTDRRSGFEATSDAKDYATSLADQVDAIEIVRQAQDERRRGVALWGRLADSAKADLFREDPQAYWQGQVHQLGTKEELADHDVVEELRRRNVALLGFIESHPDRLARPSRGGAEPRRLAEEAAEAMAAGSMVAPYEFQDPVRQLMRMRTLDLIEFSVSFIFALIATFVLLYLDKNFGTGWQYLAAIATGFTATTAVVQLLPWYRQNRLESKETTAAAV